MGSVQYDEVVLDGESLTPEKVRDSCSFDDDSATYLMCSFLLLAQEKPRHRFLARHGSALRMDVK